MERSIYKSSRVRTRFSRPATSGRGFSRRPAQRNSRRGGGVYIDPTRFINKAIITEQVEHFVPEYKFVDFLVDERLKTNIIKKGYITPTPIQDKTIPHILKGQDVVGIANTGT